MQTLQPDLHNFEGLFSDWVGEMFNRMEGYNENWRGLSALFIEKLELNIIKYKREFALRGWRGGRGCKI